MMEKRNRTIEKMAAGDSRDIDDIVDAGTGGLLSLTPPG